jgi:hypothetical protein
MRERRSSHHLDPLFALFLIFLTSFPARSLGKPSAQPSEYQVKAAFLLNFTKFVEWPPTAFAEPDAPFTICILGDDPFGSVLDQIVEGEKVNDRKLVVQRIHGRATIGCQVLFVSNSERVPSILTTVGRGVLTVGDGEDFVREGGMIGFVLERRRVRFDINQSAAANASLKLSSKLLSVARTVAN